MNEPPKLLDNADGVRGHYCIGRTHSTLGPPFLEFWNHGSWLSAGEVFCGQNEARAVLATIMRIELSEDWRTTLNAICDLIGHPRISPDEGFTASVAKAVAVRVQELERLQEESEARNPDAIARHAASLEHHEEHHRREEELTSEVTRLTARVAELEEELRRKIDGEMDAWTLDGTS